MDRIGTTSCPVADIGTNGVEPMVSTTREFVT
jgi:hypothetical protein